MLNILRLSERKQVPQSGSGEIVLCLLSPGPVAQPLQRLQGTVVRGKPVAVKTVQKGGVGGCDVLYVGRTSGLENVVRNAFDSGILTIGSDDEFMSASGGVALVVDGRRIAIVVNEALVKQGRWTFSSHLLEIARIMPGGIR